MHVALSWLLTILWWICYPIGILIYYIFTFVLNVLHLLYRPIAFILQPVVYLGRFIFAVLALPFRLLARLEVSIQSPHESSQCSINSINSLFTTTSASQPSSASAAGYVYSTSTTSCTASSDSTRPPTPNPSKPAPPKNTDKTRRAANAKPSPSSSRPPSSTPAPTASASPLQASGTATCSIRRSWRRWTRTIEFVSVLVYVYVYATGSSLCFTQTLVESAVP